jgi:CBS domain-containing protein
MKAADVMATDVITVGPEDRVMEVAQVLVSNRISAVPVVDDTGKMVGIVSEGDLIRRVESGTEHRRAWWLDLLASRAELAAEYVKERGPRVRDVMTGNVVTVSPDTDLAEVANLLESNTIKRVPVIEDGKLVGIVSRANLVQALAALHNQLPAETTTDDALLRDKVLNRLRSEAWTPMLLNVIVKDGRIGLWGFVRSEEERKAARVAAETADGVRPVDDNLIVMRPGLMGA